MGSKIVLTAGDCGSFTKVLKSIGEECWAVISELYLNARMAQRICNQEPGLSGFEL